MFDAWRDRLSGQGRGEKKKPRVARVDRPATYFDLPCNGTSRLLYDGTRKTGDQAYGVRPGSEHIRPSDGNTHSGMGPRSIKRAPHR